MLMKIVLEEIQSVCIMTTLTYRANSIRPPQTLNIRCKWDVQQIFFV